MIELRAKCWNKQETTNAGQVSLTINSDIDKNMQIYSEKGRGAFENLEEGKSYKVTIEEIEED